jgi:hypothetical protein
MGNAGNGKLSWVLAPEERFAAFEPATPAPPGVNPPPALPWAPESFGGSHDPVQLLLRRRDQLPALAGPPLGRQRAAAHHQPFARTARVGNFIRAALIPERNR